EIKLHWLSVLVAASVTPGSAFSPCNALGSGGSIKDEDALESSRKDLIMKKSSLSLPTLAALALLAAGALQAQPSLERSTVKKPQAVAPQPTIRTSREATLIRAGSTNKVACVVDPNRELFITAVSVVED